LDESLDAAYRRTDYRVRRPGGGYVSVRVGESLPQELATGEPWALVTAWNPCSRPATRTFNRHAQRVLLDRLRAASPVLIRAGLGVGEGPWREASLFVVGVALRAVETLAREAGQNAIICGVGHGQAELRWL